MSSVTAPTHKIDFAEVSIQGFQPDFIRPIPTPLPVSEDEVFGNLNILSKQ